MNIENFKIRKYRKQLKLRQEDLATQLGVSTQLIRMYENGTRNPSLETEKALCKLFNITLNEFEGGTDKEQLKVELQNLILTFNINKATFQLHKIETLKMFYYLTYDNLSEIANIISNTQSYPEQITKYILNFILKHYLCESIFLNYPYNDKLIYENNPNINKQLIEFIKSNMRFIESTIEELYYNENNTKCMIPITDNISNNFEQLKTNATEFLEVAQKYKNKKMFGYKITNDEMSMKYELGNIALVELTNNFSNDDDVIVIINKKVVLRRIRKNENGIIIQALNPVYGSEFYSNEEIQTKDIQIIGKIIGIKFNN
jgi:transcriptional regulator, XRE family